MILLDLMDFMVPDPALGHNACTVVIRAQQHAALCTARECVGARLRLRETAAAPHYFTITLALSLAREGPVFDI